MIVDFSIHPFNDCMSTKEIIDAWEHLSDGITTLGYAVDNCLEKLGFDEEEYEDGSNAEIEQLLEVRNFVDNAQSI